jgi:hypothetical protein
LELKAPAANIPANKNKSEAEYRMSARAIIEQGPNDNLRHLLSEPVA